ncbi:uncharacterized protein LOC128506983 [Clarias gariepinus]|uniref:uncharacterized protein LOC128506983 n=1 Tax=Clarias gariepinus TaxID=13013 RepID=UPI00234CAE53|nr:uncharacterized protein LOC128506983 [Clarias gariepinus]
MRATVSVTRGVLDGRTEEKTVRGKCPVWPGIKDIPVQSGSSAKDSRFSLYDDTTAKVFTVTITDLTPEDEGTYWCAIEKSWSDIYTEIKLLVEMDVPVSITVSQPVHTISTLIKTSSVHVGRTSPATATQLNEVNNQTITHSSHDIPGNPGYIVMGGGAVLFIVAVIIGIYCKRKHQVWMKLEMVLIFTFCVILAGTDAVTTVTGYRGRSVQIKCPYTSGHEQNNKYLCRGNCPTWDLTDVPVQSGSPVKDSRFSLYDDTTAKVFTVTITDLRPEDAGTYWCTIDQKGRDKYTEILLLVKNEVPATTTVSYTTHSTLTHSMSTSVHAERTHSTTGSEHRSNHHR